MYRDSVWYFHRLSVFRLSPVGVPLNNQLPVSMEMNIQLPVSIVGPARTLGLINGRGEESWND